MMTKRIIVLLANMMIIFGCGDQTTAPVGAQQIKAPEDVTAAPADAKRTASGLAYRVLSKAKSKAIPRINSTVVVHYSGWTTDGRSFDSSVGRGTPSTFGVDQVIPGWTEALQLMSVGEKWRLWIPEGLAYKGQSGMPRGMLVFDVELLSIKGVSNVRVESTKNKPTQPEAKPVTATKTEQAIAPSRSENSNTPKDVKAPPADAVTTSSGLATKILRAGTGQAKPTGKSMVTVHYQAWTTDGNLFDSSFRKGEPVRLPLDGVVKGLSEGLALMVVGEKRRLWIPDQLAFKHQPGGSKGMVVFDVELIKIEAQQPEPKAPADVSGPPADALQTPSGLFHKLLSPGTGEVKPTVTSAVRVNYTGWTTDGQVFDSSIVRGKPSVFPLVRVVTGWAEGLQLMVVGEKRRLWIPEALAYKGQPGRPPGMLVFDVELLDIIKIPTTLPKSGASQSATDVPMKKGQMGDFDPLSPPPGFVECHDLHCHHENGMTFSYAAVMKKMGTETLVGEKGPDPKIAPANVSKPPANSEKTASGIAHILLSKNRANAPRRPMIDSIVRFHFSGWTRSGESFLSTLPSGREVQIPLVSIPSAALVEAIKTLSVGEKRRFWIPGALMGRDKGMQVPPGDLTYDIELIDFQQ
jgi:FKBP-type peptidyl-prolyl cis-trans isomerase